MLPKERVSPCGKARGQGGQLHPGTVGAGRFPVPQSRQRWFPSSMALQASLSQESRHWNASKGHWNPLGSRIGWSDGLGNDAVVQGSSGELWDSADRQSRQAHLPWGTSTLHVRQFWFLPWGSAHRPLQSQTKAFQLKQNPGQDRSSQVVSLHTGFILRLMASAFKARGFTFAKQSEIYIFVLPSRRQRKWVSRSQKPLQSKVSQPWLASVLYLSKVFSHQER